MFYFDSIEMKSTPFNSKGKQHLWVEFDHGSFEFTYLKKLIDLVHRNHVSKLRHYDGSIPQNYYINGVKKVTSQEDKNMETEFCSADVICYGGEEEFELIMRGDFTAFNRSDCALRFNEVFRWAWESWRAAVGNEIGKIYAKAIDIMNIGASANGKLFKFLMKIKN